MITIGEACGNVLEATSRLRGLATPEFGVAAQDHARPDYHVVIAGRAAKPPLES